MITTVPTETLHFENARVAQQLYNNDTRNLQAVEQQLHHPSAERRAFPGSGDAEVGYGAEQIVG